MATRKIYVALITHRTLLARDISYLTMDLVRLLLLDLPSGIIYLNICMILNF